MNVSTAAPAHRDPQLAPQLLAQAPPALLHALACDLVDAFLVTKQAHPLANQLRSFLQIKRAWRLDPRLEPQRQQAWQDAYQLMARHRTPPHHHWVALTVAALDRVPAFAFQQTFQGILGPWLAHPHLPPQQEQHLQELQQHLQQALHQLQQARSRLCALLLKRREARARRLPHLQRLLEHTLFEPSSG